MNTSAHDALLYMAQAFQTDHYRHLGGEKKSHLINSQNSEPLRDWHVLL